MFNYFVLLILISFLISCGPPDDFFDLPPSPYGKYSEASVNYFLEIALCPEFEVCTNPRVKKWNSEIRIQLNGNYNESDERQLDNIISELSNLTGLSIKKVTNNANINIYFVNQSQFKRYIPEYNESNSQEGLYAVKSSNSDNIFYEATICIKNNIDDVKKYHLLREELTQSLGLTDDSELYTNSVFQQNPQYKPTQYSDIDKEVIRLLYDNKIKPGMNRAEVKSVLATSSVQTASN